MKTQLKLAVIAASIAATPVAATNNIHLDSAGIYSPGTVVVTFPTGTKTDYSALVNFTGSKAGGAQVDIIGFCVDLYHNIFVNIGSQRAVSLDYHRGALVSDGNGTALSSTQAQQIGGLATLGFAIAAGSAADRNVRLAAIQQAIWTIEYPTLSFDGSGSFAGQQGFADAYVAAASSLRGVARAFYADDGNTQGFVVAGVPEPASWALMIGGFAAIGVAGRRRRTLIQVTA